MTLTIVLQPLFNADCEAALVPALPLSTPAWQIARRDCGPHLKSGSLSCDVVMARALIFGSTVKTDLVIFNPCREGLAGTRHMSADIKLMASDYRKTQNGQMFLACSGTD